MKITDEMVQVGLAAYYEADGLHIYDTVQSIITAAIPHLQPVDVAAVRRQALEEAARLVETSAYRSTTEGRSLVPCQFAKHDQHHATIAASIRALSAEPAQGEQWHPIETAPKDELVIVYTPPKTGDDTCRIDFDYIDTGIAEGYWFNHGEAREHFECVGKPDCWSGGIPSEAPYTHWMPLPAAPTTEEKK